PSDGYWKYAVLNQSRTALIPGPSRVALDPVPPGLATRLRAPRPLNASAALETAAAPSSGPRPTLVILVQCLNKTASPTPASSQSRFFGPTNSVRDHYLASSYNQMTLTPAADSHGTVNDGVVGWLTLNYNHPNPGRNIGAANVQLTADAIV